MATVAASAARRLSILSATLTTAASVLATLTTSGTAAGASSSRTTSAAGRSRTLTRSLWRLVLDDGVQNLRVTQRASQRAGGNALRVDNIQTSAPREEILDDLQVATLDTETAKNTS